MTVAAIIVAAGKGERAGGETPKQYVSVGGKALLLHSVDALAAHSGIDHLVLVVPAGDEDLATAMLGAERNVSVVTGGTSRHQSVRNGLDRLVRTGAEWVLIHDAARPFVPSRVIDDLLEALDIESAAVPVLSVVDTLAKAGKELGPTLDRSSVVRVQTPQAFHLGAVVDAHDKAQDDTATDDAQLVRALGMKVATVEGDALLEKITHPADFALAEARLAATRSVRTGMGFDVHRLEAAQELWLGGLLIAHDKGLAGHSDADVALHALTDALLGAAGEGDIGDHFPPSDPQWRGAPSSRFLEHARNRIVARGGAIDHVDLTIICEAPRIGPHRGAMRARIAELLRVELSRVSVKATTTERLGFTGRGEGIAAQAVATIRI